MGYTQQDLDLAQSLLSEVERRVQHERYLLKHLRGSGRDTAAGEDLLRILERTVAELIAHRDKIADGLRRSGGD